MIMHQFSIARGGWGRGFHGGSVVKNPPARAGDTRDVDLISGLGRSPGEEKGNPLQYSCLEDPMDRAAWQATVHVGHKESDTTEGLQFMESQRV